MLDIGTRNHSVETRAVGSVINLAGREVAIRLLALGGGIVLARKLSPSEFGLFAIAYFATNFFATFSELGLGAAYIRMPGEVSRQDLNALFTFQLVLVSGLAAVLVVVAPLVASFYHAPQIAWLIRALSVALVVISLRSAPTVAAERHLRYGPIALSDVVRHLTFWLIAVAAALAGFGVWSLVSAVVVSACAGALALFGSTKWAPSLEFDWSPIRRSLRFGMLYQAQAVSHFVKDTMIPSLGGILYGTTAVGYLTWAHQVALVPLLLTGLISRVSYPALARLQHDSGAFRRMLEATLGWACRLSLPVFAVLVALTPEIIQYVYGQKWLAAAPSLYLLYVNMALSIGTGVLMPALYSAGRPGLGLRISVVWVLLTYVSAIAFARLGMGFVALAVAYASGTLVALTLIVVQLRILGKVTLVPLVAFPLASSLALGGLLYLTGKVIVHGVVGLCLLAAFGVTIGIVINIWQQRSVAFRTLRLLWRGRFENGALFGAQS